MGTKHTTYFDLIEALEQPGCALCRLGHRSVEQYLDTMLYESVNDADTQEVLVASHGLCSTHSEVLLHHRDTLGTAILYDAILTHLQAELEELPEADGVDLSRRLKQRVGLHANDTVPLAANEQCPVCRQRDDTVARIVGVLNAHGDDPEIRAAVRAGDGFCLPHLRHAISVLDDQARIIVVERQREVWNTYRSQLAEFIRKKDYRFRHESSGEEADIWQRVVRATAGEPNVF